MIRLLTLFLFSGLTFAASPPVVDSFRQECPMENTYPDFFEGKKFTEIKDTIKQRLSALGLEAKIKKFKDTPEDIVRLRRLARIVVPALEMYPKEFFERVDLEDVVFTKDLMVMGHFRKALPEPSSDSVYYADNNDLECEAGMESRTHHEFYHFIEGKINGDMYFKDPQWKKFNPPTASYGNGGAGAYTQSGFQNIGHFQLGFPSAYALFALEEDKAEVFAWMMTKTYAARMRDWAKDDVILSQKMDYMKTFIKRLSPCMDEKFFSRIAD